MLLRTYTAVLADSSEQSIIEAAQRFTTGRVEGQSRTFAPSVAEFVSEVEKRQELIAAKARKVPALTFYRGPLAPFQVRQQKRLAENAHLPILHENITFDQWRKMSAAREIPVGATWCSLGIVFGPEPKKMAAE